MIFLFSIKGCNLEVVVYMDDKNYLRNTLIALAKQNKPFILQATYRYAENAKYYAVFMHPKPWLLNVVNANELCNHICLKLDSAKMFYDLSIDDDGHDFRLICKGRIYRDKNGYERGGVSLHCIDNVAPFMRIDGIPDNEHLLLHRFVNFSKYANGRYLSNPIIWRPDASECLYDDFNNLHIPFRQTRKISEAIGLFMKAKKKLVHGMVNADSVLKNYAIRRAIKEC